MKYIMLFESMEPKFLVKKNKRDSIVFSLKVGGEVLKCLSMVEGPKEYYLQNLDDIGNPYFDMFIRKIVEYFKSIDMKRLIIKSPITNVKLYKKYGFKERKLSFDNEHEYYNFVWLYLDL